MVSRLNTPPFTVVTVLGLYIRMSMNEIKAALRMLRSSHRRGFATIAARGGLGQHRTNQSNTGDSHK